ncbi:hypothetical protein B0A49_11173 [Cryomyces minteri]|uniref:FAD-binding domain-containing protein n=1 Tax=Cryomyces minteri TaxID=331657 RepID=A0A4V5NFG3_9PEZI|nr:hypothetical protein B0A49_11173 [Cryomyces minteri]
MAASHHVPVLVVGGGPVGLFLALRLAQANIPVTVLEAETEMQNETKAMAHQPSIFPEFKSVGLMEDLLAAGITSGPLCFRKPKDGEPIAKLPVKPGMPTVLLLPQYRFWEILEQHLRKHECAKVLVGHRVTAIDQSAGDTVKVTVQTNDGQEKTFTTAHLVAADGSHSSTRRLCDIPFEGVTLSEQLVATDIVYPFDKHGYLDANFLVDPDNYGLVGRITKEGLWRVSYGASAAMEYDEIVKGLPAKFDAMFPGPRPLEYNIQRIAPYKAQQRCVATLRKGRVMVVGDAAHVTNPYAGLGLNTGFFDASSLAMALVSVLSHGAPESLLDAWAKARRDVFLNVVDPMSRKALARVKDADPDSLPERDPQLKGMKTGQMPMPPSLATDVRKLEGYVEG